MSTAPLIKTSPGLRTLAGRLLRYARLRYLRQRIHWAQQDMAHMARDLEGMPARIQAMSAWIEARRVEAAMLERAP